MAKVCRICQNSFEITAADLKFYEKVSPVFNGKKYLIPPPTLCPDCRQQRRLSFRNERSLYQRQCDFSHQAIISQYSPDKPFPVYHQDIWFSDKWDAKTYGRGFDFRRSFFEQFQDLAKQVPRNALINIASENSDYCNVSGWNKNCYLIFASCFSENSLYSKWLRWSKDCLDCYVVLRSEHCYEGSRLEKCFNVRYAQNCKNCADAMFLYNCHNCHDCFGCANLSNQQYCIWNKQYSKTAYEEFLNKNNSGSLALFQNNWLKFKKMLASIPRRNLENVAGENILGDSVNNSKNIYHGFMIENAQDCRYVYDVLDLADVMDCTYLGDRTQLCYEVVIGEQMHQALFVFSCLTIKNLIYCDNCYSANDCFGCVGLRDHSQYFILNKQYTKEEYEKLVPQIIEHMQTLGEWGEFFPPTLSPFGYNEALVNEYYPLDKTVALKKGFNWSNYQIPFPKVKKIITPEQMMLLPDHIKDVPDEILDWALTSEVSGKLYRITGQELEFYRKHNLPIPRRCPDQRHKDRMSLRNPRKLWPRNCMKCGKEIQTTYAPERPEIVYCEECYLKEVY